VLALAAPAAAAPGDLDPSFAGTGIVTSVFGDGSESESGTAIATQADGKTVISGRAALGGNPVGLIARFLPDGALDPTFATGGRLIDTTFDPRALAVQPDGKIVAAGADDGGGGNSAYEIARYLPNGSLDPSFGAGTGKTTVLVNAPDVQQRAEAVAIAPDGKIVAAGLTNDGAGIVRLNSDGSPDASFNGSGHMKFLLTTVGGAESVAVQADGAVVAAVPTGAGLGDGFTVVRATNLGAPDTSFGPGGVQHFTVGDGATSDSLALQPDGKIVVGGSAEVASGPDQFAVARLNPNGTPDTSFSGDGQEITPVAPNNLDAEAHSLVIQPNGRIVLGGEADLASGTKSTFAFARYGPLDGSLDPTFGQAGIELTPFPAGWVREHFSETALACDGKIVSTGLADTAPATHSSFLTMRILGDPVACPGLNPPLPSPIAIADHTKPKVRIHRIAHVVRASKLRRFSGSASDNGGVAKVEIALLRRVGKAAAFSRRRPSCLWLRNSRSRFKRVKPRRGKCATARFLRAKGTTKWLFKLRGRLPAGSYVLYARATDTSGNRTTSFSSKRGDRVSFRVRKG